jgi:hypothetical protein
MVQTSKRLNAFTWFLVGIGCALFCLFWLNGSAHAQQANVVGRVEAMPPSGLIGAWRIAGRDFATNANTEFRTYKGRFALGACVEVEFTGASPFTVTKLAVKNNEDCGAAPGSTPTPDRNRARGPVEEMPQSGLIGAWRIGGAAYTVNAGSQLRQEHPFVLGACVDVEFVPNTGPRQVTRMRTIDPRACNNQATPPPSETPEAGEQNGLEVYGRIDSFPASLIGVWIVNRVEYTATTTTEFKQERGAFAAGRCVKLHLVSSTPPLTIREIETMQGFRCNGSEIAPPAHGELYGEIQSLPTGFPTTLTGDWNIGGMSFVATSDTQFKQERGAFAVGVMVKVHFYVGSDGRNYAREIESKLPRGDDDHGGGHHNRPGHAFGVIEQLPSSADLIGEWRISGISYTVTSNTRLTATVSYTLNSKVIVHYRLDENNKRLALAIRPTHANGSASQADHFRLFGYVTTLPASGFVGPWNIDNIGFFADGQTEFKEDHGLLAMGAYVAVEYSIVNGRNRIHEIETQVPPGAGDNTSTGVISNNGGALQAASANDTLWVIGGVSYVVTSATDLNDLENTLEIGNTAQVNSYTAGDGTQVATQIIGVNLNHKAYLPLTMR